MAGIISSIGADPFRITQIPEFKPGMELQIDDTLYLYMRGHASSVTSTSTWYVYNISAGGVPTVVGTGLRTAAAMSISYPVGICVPQARSTQEEGVTTVPANYYFWGAVAGRFRAYGGANCAANAKIYTSASTGVVDDDSTSQEEVKGVVLETTLGGSIAIGNFYAHRKMTFNF